MKTLQTYITEKLQFKDTIEFNFAQILNNIFGGPNPTT